MELKMELEEVRRIRTRKVMKRRPTKKAIMMPAYVPKDIVGFKLAGVAAKPCVYVVLPLTVDEKVRPSNSLVIRANKAKRKMFESWIHS